MAEVKKIGLSDGEFNALCTAKAEALLKFGMYTDKKVEPYMWKNDQQEIAASVPAMKSALEGGLACHEVHTFLAPVWIKTLTFDDELIAKYSKVVEIFNNFMSKSGDENLKSMKNPVLTLVFRDVGDVTVMQASWYVLSNDVAKVVTLSHHIADLFTTAGFQVLREKIEATARGITGIPKTREEMDVHKKYFEFHIRVERKDKDDSSPVTDEEVKELVQVGNEFGESFGIPVPLSYNQSKQASGQFQRYLNARFRGIGTDECFHKVKEIADAVNARTKFRVVKTIEEYVWYDTMPEMDKGWIDF